MFHSIGSTCTIPQQVVYRTYLTPVSIIANLQLIHGHALAIVPSLLNRCTNKEWTFLFLLARRQATSACKNIRLSDIPALIDRAFCHGFDLVYKFWRVAMIFPLLSKEEQINSNLLRADNLFLKVFNNQINSS